MSAAAITSGEPQAPDTSLATPWVARTVAALTVGLLAAAWVAMRPYVSSSMEKSTGALLVTVVPALIAGLYAFSLRKRDDIGERTARGWAHVGTGCLALAATFTVAIAPEITGTNVEQFATVALITYGVAGALLLLGLSRWVRRLTASSTASTAIDLVIVGLLAYAAIWNSTIKGAFVGGSSIDGLARTTLLAHSLLDSLLLLVAVMVVSQIGRNELRGAEICATFGIIGIATADLWLTWLAGSTGDLTGTLADIATGVLHSRADMVFALGMTAIAVAAATRSRRDLDTVKVPLSERSLTWEAAWTLAPFVALGLLLVGWEDIRAANPVVRTTALIIVGALVLRGALIAVTNLLRARTPDIDPLTGAHNHRRLQEMLGTMARRAETSGRPLTLVMVDVDDFTFVNETYSHAEGDRFLRELAWIMQTTIDPNHTLFRPGGDEFAIAMPDTTPERAVEIAQEIERAADGLRVVGGAAPSLTMGVASLPLHAEDAHQLIEIANGTLYWGKHSGKRTVTVYDPAVVTVLNDTERVRVIEQNAKLRSVLALARALDARDAYTARHSQNVSRYAVAIAEQLHWTPEQQSLIRVAGLLHDVGKIAVDDAILRKSDKLTEEERDEMRKHPAIGAQVITGIAPDEIVPWVLSHHERYDGRGYPQRLMSTEIPLGARVLAVADAFDAMTTSRSYRPGLSTEWALAEIGNKAGSQFDPEVVRAFLRAVALGTLRPSHEHADAARAPSGPVTDVTELTHDVLDAEFAPVDGGADHDDGLSFPQAA